MAIGSIWDVAKRRIPNALTSVVALGGITAQIVDRGGLAALSGVAAAVVSIALLYKPWTAGGLGGGDVKLAAAVAIWVGLGGLFRYAVAVAAAGGLVAAMMYFLSRKAIRQEIKASLTLAALNQSLPPVPAPSPGRLTVPYGLAIAAGAAFALLT